MLMSTSSWVEITPLKHFFQLTLDPHHRVQDDFKGTLHVKIGEFLNVLRVKNEKKILECREKSSKS